MKNPNWPRWIFASASKHFFDAGAAATPAIPVFVENQKRDTEEEITLWEFRLDGPNIVELSKNFYELKVEINILIQTKLDIEDAHRHFDVVGIAQEKMENTISVFKYGNRAGDDDTFLECLHLRTEINEPVFVNHFGQIEPTTHITQSTVEGHYRMTLST